MTVMGGPMYTKEYGCFASFALLSLQRHEPLRTLSVGRIFQRRVIDQGNNVGVGCLRAWVG